MGINRSFSLKETWKRVSDYFGLTRRSGGLNAERLTLLRDLEKEIGYTFSSKELLNRALSHRSYAHDNGKGTAGSYERLEFLGDTVLGMLVSEELYKAYPDMMEGDLTKIKSSLVSRSSLARCSESFQLEKYLLFTGGIDLMQGRSKVTILADSFEAILGAMYLEGKTEVVRRFLNKVLMESKDSISSVQILHSTKSNLLQLSQERFRSQPTYKVVKTTGPEHDKVFTCEVSVANKWVARGTGSSKKEAEKIAALNALRILDSENVSGIEDGDPPDNRDEELRSGNTKT